MVESNGYVIFQNVFISKTWLPLNNEKYLSSIPSCLHFFRYKSASYSDQMKAVFVMGKGRLVLGELDSTNRKNEFEVSVLLNQNFLIACLA